MNNEYVLVIGNRITKILKEHGISQRDILDEAATRGYDIKQSELSKICNGKSPNPRVETLAQIADILNVSLDALLSLDTNKTLEPKEAQSKSRPRNDNSTPSNIFITNPDNIHMKCYIGSFHTYFFPTQSTANKSIIRKGQIDFKRSDDNKKVIATLVFKTGKKDASGKEITTHYEGELIVSTFMSIAYCWVKNNDIGKICYIIFHHYSIAYEGLYAKVALVITSSTGKSRLPTAHRMLISVPEIKNEDLEIIKGQLYLNGREILISESEFEEMLKREEIQNNEKIKKLFQRDETHMKIALSPITYYKIDEAHIKNSFLDYESQLLLINLLRQYSSMPRYIKVGVKSDIYLYDFLKNRYGPKK